MMIDQIDDILFFLRNSDSKKPMTADMLAAKLEMTTKRFEEVMDIICNIVPAPVNRAYKEVTENVEKQIPAFKGYVYWPTGVVEKAKRQHINLSSPKPAQQVPLRTEISTEKVSIDTYEPPVFGQSSTTDEAVTEIEKIIDSQKQAPVIATVPDYSDKPKAYQIFKFIEVNPGATTKQLSDSVGTADIGNYVKSYLKRGLVVCGKNEDGKRTWSLKEGFSADQVYETRKGGSNHIQQPGEAQHEATPIHEQPQETTATGALDAQATAAEPQRIAMPEIQTATVETHQPEVGNDHPAAKVRFAITNDRHMILMGLAAEDIELTEADSYALIKFCGDIALAANVSDALATRMVDLETLGS
jgi:hypothetical protein